MVKLLLHSRYDPDTDTQPWNSRFLTFIKTTNIDLLHKDNKGWTVVHHLVASAEAAGKDVILRLLAKVGAPLEAMDNQDRTPVQLASPGIADILQELIAAEGALHNRRPSSSSPPLSVSPPIAVSTTETTPVSVPDAVFSEPAPESLPETPVVAPAPVASVEPAIAPVPENVTVEPTVLTTPAVPAISEPEVPTVVEQIAPSLPSVVPVFEVTPIQAVVAPVAIVKDKPVDTAALPPADNGINGTNGN
jgi:hypothetical protein